MQVLDQLVGRIVVVWLQGTEREICGYLADVTPKLLELHCNNPDNAVTVWQIQRQRLLCWALAPDPVIVEAPAEDDMQEFGESKVGQPISDEDRAELIRNALHNADTAWQAAAATPLNVVE